MTAHLATLVDGIGTRLIDRYRRWMLRRQTATQLLQLDDHMLSDIGVSRSEIPYLAARQAAHRVAREREDHQRAAQARLRRVPRLTVREIAEDIAFRNKPCTAC